MKNLVEFSVWVDGQEDYARRIIAPTRGKAKSRYVRETAEIWNGDLDFRWLRTRKLGSVAERGHGPTPQAFKDVANRRGVPWVRVGTRVSACGVTGTVVDFNYSDNFDVIFDGSDGTKHNVHPRDLEPFEESQQPQR